MYSSSHIVQKVDREACKIQPIKFHIAELCDICEQENN